MKPLRVFVIQPYLAKHSKVFWRIIKKTCDDTKGEFEAFRADTEPTNAGPRLQDRIDSYIKKADICIADLTGSRNENALLEVGAAYTLNLPVIPVSDTDLPSDIKGNLYIGLNPNKLDNENVIKNLQKDVLARLTEASHARLTDNNRSNQSVVYGYASRRTVDFFSFIQRCQERIDILTTNLGFIVSEKLVCGLDKKKKTFLDMIATISKDKPENFTIRILALDPDSNFTNERASALHRNRQEFREHMRRDLNQIKSFVESDRCTVSIVVKTYDAYPLQMTYFFDDYVISSVVAFGRSSRECVTYIHSLHEKGAKETYERHFENLWGSATLYATNNKYGN